MHALQAFISGLQQQIAAATTLEEVEALQAQLNEIAEAIADLQYEVEDKASEIQAELDRLEDEEELKRTGKLLKKMHIENEFGDIFIEKYKNLWVVALGNSFYGQVADFELPSSTPEKEVTEKASFNLKHWPYEIRGDVYYPMINGKSVRVEVSAERIKAIGSKAAREEAENLISCSKN